MILSIYTNFSEQAKAVSEKENIPENRQLEENHTIQEQTYHVIVPFKNIEGIESEELVVGKEHIANFEQNVIMEATDLGANAPNFELDMGDIFIVSDGKLQYEYKK